MLLSVRPVSLPQESCLLAAQLDSRADVKGAEDNERGLCQEGTKSESLKIHLQFWVMDPCPMRQLFYRKHMPWVEGKNVMVVKQDFGFIIFPCRSSLKRKCSWCSHPKPPQTSEDVRSSLCSTSQLCRSVRNTPTSSHWDPAGHPEDPGDTNNRDTTVAWYRNL